MLQRGLAEHAASAGPASEHESEPAFKCTEKAPLYQSCSMGENKKQSGLLLGLVALNLFHLEMRLQTPRWIV